MCCFSSEYIKLGLRASARPSRCYSPVQGQLRRFRNDFFITKVMIRKTLKLFGMSSQFYVGIRSYKEKVKKTARGDPFICETVLLYSSVSKSFILITKITVLVQRCVLRRWRVWHRILFWFLADVQM